MSLCLFLIPCLSLGASQEAGVDIPGPSCPRLSQILQDSGSAEVSFGGKCVETSAVASWLVIFEDAVFVQDQVADIVNSAARLEDADLSGPRRFIMQTRVCNQRSPQGPRLFFVKVVSVLVAAPTWLGFWMFSVAKKRWKALRATWESLPKQTRDALKSFRDSCLKCLPLETNLPDVWKVDFKEATSVCKALERVGEFRRKSGGMGWEAIWPSLEPHLLQLSGPFMQDIVKTRSSQLSIRPSVFISQSFSRRQQ